MNGTRNSRSRRARCFPFAGVFAWSAARATAFAILAVFVVLGTGCSPATSPSDDNFGSINMRLTLDAPSVHPALAGGGRPMEFAQPVIDSLAVCVFRGGNGTFLEVKKGVIVSGAGSTINVTVTCIAEANKKVSVELFEGGVMMYFGVDEDVTVQPSANTDINIEAVDIRIDDFTVDPMIASSGETVRLHWSSVPAAGAFGVQESRTALFDNIIWETLTTDTLLLLTRNLGTHYFRVAPMNKYTTGSLSVPSFCYVTAGTEPAPSISGIEPDEAPPGHLVTVSGVNLDLPGTRVLVGDTPCPIVSAGENEMVIWIPLNAQTGNLYLWTILGDHYPLIQLTVQRIAFVTASNGSSIIDGYVERITADPTVIANSGVAVVRVEELDWREMSVFDLIVVCGDTGDMTGDWGGDARRAQEIAESGAQVLAIGTGGAEYLQLESAVMSGLGVTVSMEDELYVPDGALPVFSLPNPIIPSGPSNITISQAAENVVSFHVPAGAELITMGLYASLVGGPDYFPMMDHQESIHGAPVRYFFWGYDGEPSNLTVEADGCLSNIINLLMAPKIAQLTSNLE